MAVRTGLDVWVSQGFADLQGAAVGAIVNPTSVDGQLSHLADLLAGCPTLQLKALFGPEHGVRGEAQYMEAVQDVPRDRKTSVPVYSLYGHTEASLSPTGRMGGASGSRSDSERRGRSSPAEGASCRTGL